MTRTAAFKLSDVQRAVRAVQAVGLPVNAVEISPDGMIRVVTSEFAVQPPVIDEFEQWEISEGLLKIMPDGSRVEIPFAKTARGIAYAEEQALRAARRGKRRA